MRVEGQEMNVCYIITLDMLKASYKSRCYEDSGARFPGLWEEEKEEQQQQQE